MSNPFTKEELELIYDALDIRADNLYYEQSQKPCGKMELVEAVRSLAEKVDDVIGDCDDYWTCS